MRPNTHTPQSYEDGMGYRFTLGNGQKRILLALYSYQGWIDGISDSWARGLMHRPKPLMVKRAFMTRRGKRYEYRITKHGIRYVEAYLLNREDVAA